MRYVVRPTPDRRRWGILDRYLCGYVTLVDEHLNLWPLEWHTRAGAEAWLHRCFRIWAEPDCPVPIPHLWQPLPHEPSPFQR